MAQTLKSQQTKQTIPEIDSKPRTLNTTVLENSETTIQEDKSNLPALYISPNISYLGQKPWLTSVSIKDNILMNKAYNKENLQNSIIWSGLYDDILTFKEGIDKHVGEGGETLSGGQKARVALAMCLYQNPDIYLLDDPLSALDANVASYVMEHTIFDKLKNKTRVLVTHSLQHLKWADHIYVVDDGKIMLEGQYDDIKDTELLMKFKELEGEKKKDEASPKLKNIKCSSMEAKDLDLTRLESVAYEDELEDEDLKIAKELFKPEEQQTGSLSWKAVKRFMSMLGGVWVLVLVYILTQFSGIVEQYSYLF